MSNEEAKNLEDIFQQSVARLEQGMPLPAALQNLNGATPTISPLLEIVEQARALPHYQLSSDRQAAILARLTGSASTSPDFALGPADNSTTDTGKVLPFERVRVRQRRWVTFVRVQQTVAVAAVLLAVILIVFLGLQNRPNPTTNQASPTASVSSLAVTKKPSTVLPFTPGPSPAEFTPTPDYLVTVTPRLPQPTSAAVTANNLPTVMAPTIPVPTTMAVFNKTTAVPRLLTATPNPGQLPTIPITTLLPSTVPPTEPISRPTATPAATATPLPTSAPPTSTALPVATSTPKVNTPLPTPTLRPTLPLPTATPVALPTATPVVITTLPTATPVVTTTMPPSTPNTTTTASPSTPNTTTTASPNTPNMTTTLPTGTPVVTANLPTTPTPGAPLGMSNQPVLTVAIARLISNRLSVRMYLGEP